MNSNIFVVTLLICKFQECCCFECRGNPDAYIKRGDRFCQKDYNCPKNHEIIDCTVNCEKDTCKVCPRGQVQPFLIQSTTPDRKCFTPQGDCDDESLDYVRKGTSVPGCAKSETCQCSLSNCWYGNPCTCNRFRNGCPENEYLEFNGVNPYCKKCSSGTKKEGKGCGPCWAIPVTPDTNTSTTTAATVKSTTASGYSTLTSQTTIVPIATTTTIKEDDSLLIIVGPVSGTVFIIITVVLLIVCLRRCRRNGGTLNKAETRDNNADDAENQIETVSSPLIVPHASLLSEACSTPRSLVVSETGQPGMFHPTDPRALRHTGGLQGRSLGDESYTDSSMTTSERENLNSSCTETPAVDSMGNSEGLNYILDKLNDDDTQIKQPVQCEEDTLRSHTFQKYFYSDVTHQKEILCEGGFHSLTDEKLLRPARYMSDRTDPKYCTDS